MFWGIALATWRGSHQRGPAVGALRQRGPAPSTLLATALTLAFLLPLAWMVWVKLGGAGTQATSDLRLPLVWFYAVSAAGVTAAALLATLRLVSLWRGSAIVDADGAGMMDRNLVAALGFALMFVLLLLRVPIGIAMGISGCWASGCCGLRAGAQPAGQRAAVGTDRLQPQRHPMFILMGAFCSTAGMSRELFDAGLAWVGHRRGGLARPASAPARALRRSTGSSVATAATLTQVALPEMRKAGYRRRVVHRAHRRRRHAGHHDPPSVIFVLYGIMTETDVTKLFFAGVVPGLLAVLFYAALVAFIGAPPSRCRRTACMEGLGRTPGHAENLWPTLALFMLVLGGMYLGWVTVTGPQAWAPAAHWPSASCAASSTAAPSSRALIDSLRSCRRRSC